jgi:hypothetical protein
MAKARKKITFTDSGILVVLKQAEVGTLICELCRLRAISHDCFTRGHGMDVINEDWPERTGR